MNKKSLGFRTIATAIAALNWVATAQAASYTLLGWNNLGMHCLDSDYSVFSILPPYNTIEAQLVANGKLVQSGGSYRITYQAVADPDMSINSTSQGKGNFYSYAPALYGAVAPDMGLAGWAMPGLNNTPQSLLFETRNTPAAGVTTPVNWFRAEGIPITPFDDAMRKNEYPLMRLVARDAANNVLATSDVVLPVSDEMDCRACHASGTGPAARPAAGWVNDSNAERDYRLNILRLHDEREFLAHPASYAAALKTRGLHAGGLYQNVVNDGRPILCASCHTSEALPGSGLADIPPLTRSIHSLHAGVTDPITKVTLDDTANRASCYRCHPGSTTKCLRGAMGNAIAADGSMAMQCQSCHGTMSQVGSPRRVGWLMEPACQSCHTGTATHNNGQIRYTSVFTDNQGTVRVAVDPTFATTSNTPAAGLSLYRFSVGHGGLQCSACHGSTHAEFPSALRNDNIRNVQLQGHAGVMAECTACHPTVPNTVNGGPHGMHPVGQAWVGRHSDVVESMGSAQCQSCHGADYRGTVLSLMQADRTVNGQKLFRGAIVGCYLCHNGPRGEGSPGPAPTVGNVSARTTVGQSVAMTLPATGASLVLRVISQPAHGSVGLRNQLATYFPEPGFTGTDTFTFAAYNGAKNSSPATGTVLVATAGGGGTAPSITTPPASQSVSAGTTVQLTVVAAGTPPLAYQWQRNGVNLADGGKVSGATTATLTLGSVTTSDAAHYQVVVSNGTPPPATSPYAVLTVSSVPVGPVRPTIVTPPADKTVTAGATATFTIVATGTAPLAYQWQRNGVNLVNGGNVSGATTSSLTLNSVAKSDAASYRAVVSNGAGAATSAAARLTVNPPAALRVTWVKPGNGAVFEAGSDVEMTARVDSALGGVRVEFYDGGTRLGAAPGDAYTLVGQFTPGLHTLSARATSAGGTAATSAPVRIRVLPREGD